MASAAWDLSGFGEGCFQRLTCPARFGVPQFPEVSGCLWSERWMGLGQTQVVSGWPIVAQADGTFWGEQWEFCCRQLVPSLYSSNH